MQKIAATNWISAARSCAPVGSPPSYVSAMAQPRAGFVDPRRAQQIRA